MQQMNLPTDQRQKLCEELLQYRSTHPDRAAEAQRILDFVQSTPDCFCRSHAAGHITGSAWLQNPNGDKVLLTLHRKLGRWLQPGGHADGCSNTLATALREATEESGIEGIYPVHTEIFDIDIHRIPARPQAGEAEHLHYDIRYLLQAPHENFRISAESITLAWWSAQDFIHRQAELDESVLRMHKLLACTRPQNTI